MALWTYRCDVVRVVDGDTLDLKIDVGFHTYHIERVRLLGIDCPEVRGPEKEAGLAASEFVRKWVIAVPFTEWPFEVTTHKTDSFGRYLADLRQTGSDTTLSQALIAAGHAVPFMEK